MNFDFSIQKEKKLAIKEKTQISFLSYHQILFFQCSSTLVFIFHSQGVNPIIFCNTLKELEAKLSCYGFLRINHNTIINMFHVKKSVLRNMKYICPMILYYMSQQGNGTKLNASSICDMTVTLQILTHYIALKVTYLV